MARSVTPLPAAPPRLMLMSCVHAGPASELADISARRKNTLRGRAAALTKSSLDGRAATPSRLRDSQSWSSAARAPGSRCARAGRAARAALPAAPAGRQCRRRDGAGQLRAVAPFRRGSDRLRKPPLAPEEVAVPGEAVAGP